jgi:hypothetical protein
MSQSEFWKILPKSEEIELGVTGRKSGKNIFRPVWLVHENNIVYLLPVRGSDTEWFKNVLHDPTMKISVNKKEFSGIGKAITEENEITKVADKFRSKYSSDNIKRYYSKLDAMVEFSLQERE